MGDVNVRQSDVSIGGSQYIAGGDINFGVAHSKDDFLNQLEKLRNEFALFAQQTGLDEEKRIEVDAKLQLAAAEVKKDQPNKQALTERLSNAKGMLESIAAAGGMVAALATAVEAVQKIF